MTQIDQIIADALAGSPETHVAILAREVVRLREARAVVVPDYETMADLAWRHHFDPLHGPTDMFAAGRTAMYKAMCAELRAIPADRELGEGMAAVEREELNELLGIESCVRAVMAYDGAVGTEERNRLKRLDALRTSQRGTDHD